MNNSTAAVPISRLDADPEGATRGAVPEFVPGWLVLRNCALGGGGPRVGLVLMHPGVGIALVDSVAKETDAVDRLRRALDARRFRAIFGGCPPIVRMVLPAGRSGDLDRALAAAFEAQPPLALAGADAWLGTARAAIEAESPLTAPEPLRVRRRRSASLGRVVVLGAAAGSVAALAAAGLLLVLPREDPENAPRLAVAAVSTPADLAPRPPPVLASAENEHATSRTAPDTAAALPGPEESASATALDAVPHLEAEAAWPGEDLTVLDVLAALMSAEPAATSGGADATVGPQASGGPPTATAAVGDEFPSAQPAPPARDAVPSDAPPPAPPSPDAANAVAGARPPPKRPAVAAALVDAPPSPPRPVPQTPVASGRRSAPPAAEAGNEARCREILVRATIGGALSDEDRSVLRRGCQPRG